MIEYSMINFSQEIDICYPEMDIVEGTSLVYIYTTTRTRLAKDIVR